MHQQQLTDEHELKLWAYARSSSSRPSVLIQQMQGLLADAERNHWTVVGTSQDMSTGRTLARMGLREAQSAVRQGLANGILIEDVGRLSHEYSTALRVLEFLQDHGAVLICTQADVRYELYIKGLSQPLQQRAMSKGVLGTGWPWYSICAAGSAGTRFCAEDSLGFCPLFANKRKGAVFLLAHNNFLCAQVSPSLKTKARFGFRQN